MPYRRQYDLGRGKTRYPETGVELVEPTSGNTGIALAYVAAARGYKLTLTMPDTMSIERRKLLKALGANLVLTEGAKGMKGAIEKPMKSARLIRPAILCYSSSATRPTRRSMKTTGPEIWEDTDGNVDVVVAGVGTGGTITGIARYLKNIKGKKTSLSWPSSRKAPRSSPRHWREEIKPGPHKIQGIGAGFIPVTWI